jgi:hypothetical protein
MFQWKPITLIVCALLGAGGCGLEHAYHTVTPSLQLSGRAQIAVGVHDQRRAVLDGDAGPDYVGLVRSGFGIPYHVTTDDDQPFSHDFADAIARGLERAGHHSNVVRLVPSMPSAQARAALIGTGAPRLVFVNIHEWKCDTYSSTSLVYDVELSVLNGRGKVLGRAQVKGTDSLGGNAEKAVSQALQQKLERLLSDASVVNAIQSAG